MKALGSGCARYVLRDELCPGEEFILLVVLSLAKSLQFSRESFIRTPSTHGLFDFHLSSKIYFEVINPHTVGSLTVPKWV